MHWPFTGTRLVPREGSSQSIPVLYPISRFKLGVDDRNVAVDPSSTILRHFRNQPFCSMSPRCLPLLASLAQSRWSLTRTLISSNRDDFSGQLHGSASFTPGRTPDPASLANPARDWLYSEEGELPPGFANMISQPGMRWRKKYIWRVTGDDERISVWFVKVAPGPEEADYLFHNFEFIDPESGETDPSGETLVTPPTPPTVAEVGEDTEVVAARGSHLCINDMYRTAYAFRIRSDTGEVLSWASRHVVHGPKKDQDIINRYEREE